MRENENSTVHHCIYASLYLYIHIYMCVCVCVFDRAWGRCSHGPWITGLTLSILLNGKPICEHFSSQRSPRLILEWVGLIHRLPPPPPPSPTALAFTTISIAINVSVPSSLADWRGRIRDSCVVPACTTRPYTCYHSREIHMEPLRVYVCVNRVWVSVDVGCVGQRKREPILWTCFLPFWKILWMF